MYASKRYTNWSPSLQTGFGGVGKDFLHPAVLQLGLRYAEGSVVGGTNRTLALMTTLKTVIEQLSEDGSDLQLRTLLKQVVDKNVQFLVTCRPLAVGMGNAIREFKNEIERFHKTTPNATFEFAKSYFRNICSSYAKEKCSLAIDAIVPLACGKIKDGDVIVTYSYSTIIQQTFLYAHEKQAKRFRVVVVDSFPRFEGRKLLESLSAAGIPCTYLLINAAAYMMREASKVMIGAAGVRANGNVSSRCGTASVCMMAHYYRVPVMVLCQTFKFTESVLLDSFCDNEIGDPEDVVAVSTPGMPSLLKDWRTTKSTLNVSCYSSAAYPADQPSFRAALTPAQVLNLTYDTTPMRYVTVIVTELGLIPPSRCCQCCCCFAHISYCCFSVPVVVRENDLLNNADMYL
jgi:translation initiation factor eIF-2B subunit delta